MRDANYWRIRAENARLMAKKMPSNFARETMLGVADDYDRLAERMERRRRATNSGQNESSATMVPDPGLESRLIRGRKS